MTPAQQRAVVGGIRRAVGHTWKGMEAARITGATLVVGRREVMADLQDRGIKVACLEDVARRRVPGPMLFDPEAVQVLVGRATDGTSMDFGEALDAIRAGAKVRREAWNGVDDQCDDRHFVNADNLPDWMNDTENGVDGCVFDTTDILATDWQVIE